MALARAPSLAATFFSGASNTRAEPFDKRAFTESSMPDDETKRTPADGSNGRDAPRNEPALSPAAAMRALTYQQAFERCLDELRAMKPEEVTRGATIDPSSAARLAEGVAYKLELTCPALVATYGATAEASLARVTLFSLATLQADVHATAALRPGDLSELRPRLAKRHLYLRTEAQSLVNRDLLDPKKLEPMRGVAGDRALTESLLMFLSLFREVLPELGARTPVTFEELDRIELETMQMWRTLAHRKHGAEARDAADLRERALTILTREYDELRRMVTFVRWHHGDADELAPSFWAKRKKRRRKRRPETPPEPPPAAPPQTPSPQTPPSKSAPAAPPESPPEADPSSQPPKLPEGREPGST
jgi:hypothetical protein